MEDVDIWAEPTTAETIVYESLSHSSTSNNVNTSSPATEASRSISTATLNKIVEFITSEGEEGSCLKFVFLFFIIQILFAAKQAEAIFLMTYPCVTTHTAFA